MPRVVFHPPAGNPGLVHMAAGSISGRENGSVQGFLTGGLGAGAISLLSSSVG